METLFTFVSPPDRCGYLPDRVWQLRYDVVGRFSAAEYSGRLQDGWRRFGHSVFRPECADCRACQSLRVDVEQFRPDRSQQRAWKRNVSDVTIVVGEPAVSEEKLRLYDRFHAGQTETKGWPVHDTETPADYVESFVENPFPTKEWCYFVGGRLVGVGYVDHLPIGLSAIYFYYDPAERGRSLGTFNVLSVIRAARAADLPHVYLGYYVRGCRSLEYKARFRPNQVRTPEGSWQLFVE
jgi:arginine-tRNA-protein transferase